jgi:tetratricopeptide (TPR) repeat protein
MKRSLVLVGSLLALLHALPTSAQFQPWQGSSIVDDPEWRKSFLGSYGFLSEAEPKVAPGEVDMLREVIDLMKVDPRAAAAMLQQQVGPDSSAALDFVLANLEFQNGRLDAAADSYRSAIGKFPDFRRAHKNLGLLLVQKSEFEEALGHLSRAAELGDRDGRTYGLMGYCYVNRENYLAAEAAYRNAILQQPDTRDWKLGLARSLLAMHHYKDAAALFDALIDENPEDTTSWLAQANAYVGLDRPLDAAVNIEAVRMMGKAESSSLVLLGDIYTNQGISDLAAEAYLEVIRNDAAAARFETAYRAAELQYRTRAYAEADELVAAIDDRYKGLSLDDELKLLTLKAKLARAQGRDKEGAKLLESIVRRDGTRGDALLELAAYYEERGDATRALMFTERARKLDGYEYQALLAQAQLLVAEGKYREAADLLRQALEIKREQRVEVFLARVERAIR